MITTINHSRVLGRWEKNRVPTAYEKLTKRKKNHFADKRSQIKIKSFSYQLVSHSAGLAGVLVTKRTDKNFFEMPTRCCIPFRWRLVDDPLHFQFLNQIPLTIQERAVVDSGRSKRVVLLCPVSASFPNRQRKRSRPRD